MIQAYKSCNSSILKSVFIVNIGFWLFIYKFIIYLVCTLHHLVCNNFKVWLLVAINVKFAIKYFLNSVKWHLANIRQSDIHGYIMIKYWTWLSPGELWASGHHEIYYELKLKVKQCIYYDSIHMEILFFHKPNFYCLWIMFFGVGNMILLYWSEFIMN